MTRSPQRGFTLLEVLLAMGLLSILVAMIFTVMNSSLLLSKTVVGKRLEETEKMAFLALMQRYFEQLPGNATMDLIWENNDAAGENVNYTSTMTFQDVPMSLNWGGEVLAAEAIQLVVENRRDGNLDVVMKFYEEEVLERTSGTFKDVDPIASVLLLEDVPVFDWQVVELRNANETEPEEKYQNEWSERSRLPIQVKLRAIFDPGGSEVEHVFWVVRKQDPEQAMRQLIGGGR